MRGAPFRGPKAGERLGRFRIESAWTSGPFGPTARARMLASDRPASLHALTDADVSGDPTTFSRIAASLRSLGSPGVLAVLDAWTEGDTHIVAVEEPEAGMTPMRVAANLPTAGTAHRLVTSIARTLAPAHRAGLVHGALGPELIAFDSGRQAWVTGMGLASLVSPPDLLRALGATGGRHLAPEQVRLERPTAAADVHALGVMLFELVSTSAPYTGDTAVALFRAIAEGAPPPLPTHVPLQIARIVSRALAKSPTDRFADAGAMLDALESSRAIPEVTLSRTRGDEEVAWGGEIALEAVGQRSTERVRDRVAAPGRVSRFTGALAQQQLAYARTRYPHEVERALASLSASDRDEITSATAVSWVRIEPFATFHDRLAHELGRPVDETHAEIVAGGSRKTFGTLWRMLLRVGGARLVMTRAPVVYSKTYDTGEMRTKDITEQGGTFVLSGWPHVPEFVLRGLRAGMSVGLESVGRTGIVMTSTRTPDGAVFNARWDT